VITETKLLIELEINILLTLLLPESYGFPSLAVRGFLLHNTYLRRLDLLSSGQKPATQTGTAPLLAKMFIPEFMYLIQTIIKLIHHSIQIQRRKLAR